MGCFGSVVLRMDDDVYGRMPSSYNNKQKTLGNE